MFSRSTAIGVEYKSGTLEALYHEEGRVTKNGLAWQFEYTLSDHLGNTRVSFTDSNNDGSIDPNTTTSNELLQTQSYYPFGLTHSGNSYQSGTPNDYQYNGKELQSELGWSDFGWRMYDPTIGRWGVVDPLAEKWITLSPYSYTANNPILFTDPDGRDITITGVYDDEGNLTGYNIHVTGKIIDDTGSLSEKQLERRRARIEQGLSNIVSADEGLTVNVTSEIGIANSDSDLSETDHAFRIVDSVEEQFNLETEDGIDIKGRGPIGENVVYLEEDFSSTTAAHEIGHSGGMLHIKDLTMSDWLHPNWREGMQNMIKEITFSTGTVYLLYKYMLDDPTLKPGNYSGNLMNQQQDGYKDSDGKHKTYQGNQLNVYQLNLMLKKYENDQLNNGKQN